MRKLIGWYRHSGGMMDNITINVDQLYVVPSGNGYSCLGFDVLIERYNRLAFEMNQGEFPSVERGTLEGYTRYQVLLDAARETGRRFTCELSPQLIRLEGRRVEVVTMYDETHRFNVGKSIGWLPIHLEIHNRRSHGGPAASREYKSVRVIR